MIKPILRDEELDWLERYKRTNGLSWKRLQDLTKIPMATLSALLNGRYHGDFSRITEQVRAFRDSIESASDGVAATAAKQFETDVYPDTNAPRARFNFANGWSASLVVKVDRGGFDAMTGSLACWPTGLWGKGWTEIGPTEAFADEAIEWLDAVRRRASPEIGQITA